MNANCGCCEGTQRVTPVPTANRPGLPALAYRVGTHATFLETMLARLSSAELPALAGLRTRAGDDPAIALLDAWAVVGDVLTFYQERTANEGYLRTATERRSILELARLIGYTLRPGVSASTYLAYTLDEDRSQVPPKPTAVTIAAGARAQSVPGPGESPQSFETGADLEARSEWNGLLPRRSRPQTAESILNASEKDPDKAGPRVYLKGIATNLKQNDPLLLVLEEKLDPQLFRVIAVTADATANRTLVRLQPWSGAANVVRAVARLRESIAGHLSSIDGLSNAMKARAKPVVELLTQLQSDLQGTPSPEELLAKINGSILTATADLRASLGNLQQFKKLAAVLQDVSTDLGTAAAVLSESVAHPVAATAAAAASPTTSGGLVGVLSKPPSLPPAGPARLGRDASTAFASKSDAGLQLLSAFQPALADVLPAALSNALVSAGSGIAAYALRVKAAPFGNLAQKRNAVNPRTGEITVIGEWPVVEWIALRQGEDFIGPILHEQPDVLYLDSSYDKLLVSSATNPSWIVIDASGWDPRPAGPDPAPAGPNLKPQAAPLAFPLPLIARIEAVQADISRADYGSTGKTTRIKLSQSWLQLRPHKPDDLNTLPQLYDVDYRVIRSAAVYTQSESLELAEEPIDDPVCGGKDEPIELEGLSSGLQSGRWLIVSGERADIRNALGPVPGVEASELVMLAGVEQRVAEKLPGDKNHTFISLAANLAYCYRRDTVVIYGNVAGATHGETRNEVLGSGDGSRPAQQFTLRQPPLTFVSASTPAGIDSTLQVRVNDVLWHETDSLAGLTPTDRRYITRTADDGKTTLVFGTGAYGARLPTGQENVKALYRNGIGKPGNVKAGQISLLSTRPLGVKAVVNPLPATGGADPESRDQARRNAPLAVMALDRLVSTQDYADFARTFAGIGKASAARLSDGRRQLVHVTIAGVDDIPIAATSDLYRNLTRALRQFGDQDQPIQVVVRRLLLLVMQARVQVLPDFQWESVEPLIRAALLDRFSFDGREFGQDVPASEAISTIQAVPGVACADLDKFDALDEAVVTDVLRDWTPSGTTALADLIGLRNRVKVDLAGVDPDEPDPAKRIHAAQLAYLSPNVAATLILNEIRT
jgi:hypothetical protein